MLKRIASLAVVSLFAVSGLAFTAPQSASAASEAIFNDNDGSNYTFTVTRTDGSKINVTPGGVATGQLRSFTLYSWECATVSYNYGSPIRRGPGTWNVSDGAIVHVNPYMC